MNGSEKPCPSRKNTRADSVWLIGMPRISPKVEKPAAGVSAKNAARPSAPALPTRRSTQSLSSMASGVPLPDRNCCQSRCVVAMKSSCFNRCRQSPNSMSQKKEVLAAPSAATDRRNIAPATETAKVWLARCLPTSLSGQRKWLASAAKKPTVRPSSANTLLTVRATGSASATSQLLPAGPKFWDLNGEKRMPGLTLQKISIALPVSTCRPSCMKVPEKSSLPPAEPPTARQGKRLLSYQARIKFTSVPGFEWRDLAVSGTTTAT